MCIIFLDSKNLLNFNFNLKKKITPCILISYTLKLKLQLDNEI